MYWKTVIASNRDGYLLQSQYIVDIWQLLGILYE